MTAAPSPELALTIACCRWPRSPRREAAIDDAAASVTNWSLFESLVTRHRVTSLARDALRQVGAALPAAVEERMRARAVECAVTALAMGRESVRLQRAFDLAGIPALIAKGTPLGMLAYGDPCLKESWDIDLLTTAESVPEAHALLGDLGYRLHGPSEVGSKQLPRLIQFGIEAEFRHRETGLTVELHWRLNRNRRILPMVSACSPSQTVDVGGAALRTFRDDILFSYLCVHGAYHAWARLKWLADLNAFIDTRREALRGFIDLADNLGAGRAARSSLTLCRSLFGTELVELSDGRPDGGIAVRFLERVAVRHISDPVALGHPTALPHTDVLVSHLLLAPGAGFFWEQVRNTWEEPLGHTRYGLAAHLLRIPLWLVRTGARIRRRWSRNLTCAD